ncbi:MAG: carbohydrate ABC transporter permease [Saccharofermentanales bacterium]
MVKDRSRGSRIIDVVVYFSATFILLVTMFPLLNILATSMSGNLPVLNGWVGIWPVEITFEAYTRVLSNWLIPNAFANSVLYTVLSTAYSVLITLMMAYPMSKRNFVLRKPIWILLVITMYFSGGLIPTFLLISQFGMYDSWMSQVFPLAISIGNLILMRIFINNIPDELEESAKLDGAQDIQVFFKIVLPLIKPGIATISLYYAVWKWNDFFNPMLYFSTYEKYPLTVILREIVLQGSHVDKFMSAAQKASTEASVYAEAYNARLQYTALIVSILPIVAVFPTLQKYFVKGLSEGAVKG